MQLVKQSGASAGSRTVQSRCFNNATQTRDRSKAKRVEMAQQTTHMDTKEQKRPTAPTEQKRHIKAISYRVTSLANSDQSGPARADQ